MRRKSETLKPLKVTTFTQCSFLDSMTDLLAKLRINYSSLVLLQGVFDPPKEATIRMHTKLLDGFLEGQNEHCFVSDVEREKLKEKTNMHLRLREMLREHSKGASLIVMSLPMPRQVRIFSCDSIAQCSSLLSHF